MDKKLISQVIRSNLYLLVFTIMVTVFFMRDINQALYTPNDMGVLSISSVEYNIISLKIGVVQGTFNKLHTIYNYPLIPLSIVVIYNIYFWIKAYRNRN